MKWFILLIFLIDPQDDTTWIVYRLPSTSFEQCKVTGKELVKEIKRTNTEVIMMCNGMYTSPQNVTAKN